MDILYHHRTQGTGAEGVHIAYIIKGFRDLGFDVHVVSPNGADPVKTAGSNPYTKKGGFKSRLNSDSRELTALPLVRVARLVVGSCVVSSNGRYWRDDTHSSPHRRRQMF
jgi:putative intracellular protease/amidase